MGSPPHVRGKEKRKVDFRQPHGITPACAGKRPTITRCTKWQRDHPRVCGEKFTRKSAINCGSGSPPRMRGKGHMVFQLFPAHRITPAYAGKRSFSGRGLSPDRDHPRTCGEKARQGSGLNLILGSPPHVRGKGNLVEMPFVISGITPAYAGKRVRGIPRTYNTRDHPRVCGEKSSGQCISSRHLGSPPRMRGKGVDMRISPTLSRITPAYAGKSLAFHSGS